MLIFPALCWHEIHDSRLGTLFCSCRFLRTGQACTQASGAVLCRLTSEPHLRTALAVSEAFISFRALQTLYLTHMQGSAHLKVALYSLCKLPCTLIYRHWSTHLKRCHRLRTARTHCRCASLLRPAGVMQHYGRGSVIT